MRHLSFIALSAGLLVAGGSPAFARHSPGFIQPGTPIAAPRGFVEMCAKNEGPLCDNAGATAEVEVAAYSAPVGADGPTGSIGGTVNASADPVPCLTGTASEADVAVRRSDLDLDAPIRVKATYSSLDGLMLAPLDPAVLAAVPAMAAQVCKPRSAPPLIALQASPLRPALGFESGVVETAQAVVPPTVEARPAKPLGTSAMKMLIQVNRFVNRRVVQRTDFQMFGRGEVWRRSGTGRGAQGDCEDLAIEKRLNLLARGFPADRLFFAVVYRGDIGLHTILIARADDGDYVLDSLTPHVVTWDRAPYSWISAQAPGRPNEWNTVQKPGTYPDNSRLAAQVPAEPRPANQPT